MHWRFLPQSVMATTFAIQWLSNITILFTLSLYSTIMTSFSWLLVHYLNGLMDSYVIPWVTSHHANIFILILELSQIWPVGASSRECPKKQVQLALQKVQNEIQGKMASAFPCAFLHAWTRTGAEVAKDRADVRRQGQGPSYWTDITGINSFL